MKSMNINHLTRFSRTIIALCLGAGALICFISCEKDKVTKSDQLKHKWNLVKKYDTIYSSIGYSDTLERDGIPGEYFEFGNNDTVTQVSIGPTGAQFVYKYYYHFNEPEMTLENHFGTPIYEIPELTDKKLQLYQNLKTGSHSYHITHYILNRD